MRHAITFLATALMALLVIGTPAYAQIPRTFSYQGVLNDEKNKPLEGGHTLVFTLYDNDVPIWTEKQPVTLAKGVFSVTIGKVKPIPESVDFNRPYSLGIAVDGGDELTPRTELLAVPYALRANGLVLPYSEKFAGSNEAFTVTTTDDANAVNGYAEGTGRAGYFEIDNTENTSDALTAITNGDGDALYVRANGGFGEAGNFAITNEENDEDVVSARHYGLGDAINGYAYGEGRAGYFQGDVLVTGKLEVDRDVQINGTLAKFSGSFKIDHPLDPANKYLYHSFVESPDMMNIYNGNVVLDARGEAWVELPGWFEALNRDYRYQLTSIGAPGPNLYVARKVAGNRFMIAGGVPGAEVSWQVTGVRQDAWANAHRIPVEETKPASEQGHYLSPELFGQPDEKRIDRARKPELMERMKQVRDERRDRTRPGDDLENVQTSKK